MNLMSMFMETCDIYQSVLLDNLSRSTSLLILPDKFLTCVL